jgi:AcrR family transcriptional regulator
MAAERSLTAKGSRQAEAIVDAAIRCLGRDGYSGTSLQRVADEAGVQKRMVVYYFGSRHGLIARVVERIADRFLTEVEETFQGLHDPGQVLDAGLEVLWRQLSADRAMQAAYFGLVAESATDPAIRASLAALRDRGRVLVHRVLDDLEAAGHRLTMDRDLLLLAANAGVHGLGLELLERGETRELELAVALLRAALPLLLFE